MRPRPMYVAVMCLVVASEFAAQAAPDASATTRDIATDLGTDAEQLEGAYVVDR